MKSETIVFGTLILLFVFLVLTAVTGIFVFVVTAIKNVCAKSLEYSRYFSVSGAIEGEEIYLVEELTNHSFFPMFNINVESHVTSSILLTGCVKSDNINQHFISTFFVMPFTKIRRKHRAICAKRGHYFLESAQIAFVGKDVFVESKAELYIYPRQLTFRQENIINRYIQFGSKTNLNILEDVFELSGVRPYVTGDSINAINHKATARMNKLMVNGHEYMMGRKVLIYIDFHKNINKHQHIEDYENLMELELSYAAYISLECAENGYLYTTRVNGKADHHRLYIADDWGTGMQHHMELLEELSKVRYDCDYSISTLMDEDIEKNITTASVILFTTYADSALDKRIDMFERLGNDVQVVLLDEGYLENSCTTKELAEKDMDNEVVNDEAV